MYQNIIFDLYGTLVDLHTDENKMLLWKKLAAFYRFQGANYTASSLKARYLSLVKEALDVSSPYLYKDIQIESIFQALYEEQKVSPEKGLVLHTAQFFRILSTKYIRLYDGALSLLTTLKKKGKHIYLLSNAQRVFTEFEMKSLGIYDLFDGILLSSDAYCSKPDPAFFDNLFTTFGLKKAESILIGNDSFADIDGAATYGIDSIYIHSNQSSPLTSPLNCNYTMMKMDLLQLVPLLSD